MVSDYERLINAAIRRKDIVTINEYMVPFPEPEVVYYCPRPGNLDRLHGKYYPRAILDHVEYSVKGKTELAVICLWSREWNVTYLTCRGAKRCRNELCKTAQTWFPIARRTKICPGCKGKNTMDKHRCDTKFYYLEECDAEEGAQVLFSFRDHSHKEVAPFKVRQWVKNEIERIALATALQPRDIHAGRGTETSNNVKVNLLVHCPALANLDRIGAIMRHARRRANSQDASNAEFGPGDTYKVTRSLLMQHQNDLDQSMCLGVYVYSPVSLTDTL